MIIGLGAVACGSEDPPDFTGPPMSTCMPSLPAAFSPAWKPPRRPAAACTTSQIQGYYTSCFASRAKQEFCYEFSAISQNESCIACMVSDSTDPALGAVVRWPNRTVEANIAGCMMLIEGSSDCGEAYLAMRQCQYAACEACDVSTDATYDSFLECKKAAGTGVCAELTRKAACEGAAQYDACFYVGFAQYFYGLGQRFCLADPDGGTRDAAVD